MFMAAEGWSSVHGDCLESEEVEGGWGRSEITASDSVFTLEEALAMLPPGSSLCADSSLAFTS